MASQVARHTAQLTQHVSAIAADARHLSGTTLRRQIYLPETRGSRANCKEGNVVWKRQKTRCHCCTSYHSLLLRGTSLQAENRHDHKWPRSGSGPTLKSRASKPLPDGGEEHEIFQTSRRSLRQVVDCETDENGRSKRCCFLASPKTGDMRSILYDGHNFIPCRSLCPPWRRRAASEAESFRSGVTGEHDGCFGGTCARREAVWRSFLRTRCFI